MYKSQQLKDPFPTTVPDQMHLVVLVVMWHMTAVAAYKPKDVGSLVWTATCMVQHSFWVMLYGWLLWVKYGEAKLQA